MKATAKTNTARFPTKGHGGTPKSRTAKHLESLRGSLKGAGVLQALMEDRKREREL